MYISGIYVDIVGDINSVEVYGYEVSFFDVVFDEIGEVE